MPKCVERGGFGLSDAGRAEIGVEVGFYPDFKGSGQFVTLSLGPVLAPGNKTL